MIDRRNGNCYIISGISAVLDISEFDADERIHFVSRFIKGLLDLPREHWRHCMVVLDEAHVFAPQREKNEAKKDVIALAGRGRKRGYCPVLATQRLAVLDKSVAAELQNRLIGLAVLDIDRRRSADELGMSALSATASLAVMKPGEFFVYGPALTSSVQRVMVGPVQTTHGVRLGATKPPAPLTAEAIDAIYSAAEVKKPDPKATVGQVPNQRIADAPKDSERDEVRAKIAAFRLQVIQPLLTVPNGQRTEAVEGAAAKWGINASTIFLWISMYKSDNPLGSLTPSRIPSNGMRLLEQAAQANAKSRPRKAKSRTPTKRQSDRKPARNAPKAKAPRKKGISKTAIKQKVAARSGVRR